MRTKFGLLFVLLAFVSSAQALEAGSPPVLAPEEQQAKAAHLSAQVLTYYHYKKVPLNDALSAKIIDRYIELLDPERVFFLQSDIDQFMINRDKIDDAIFNDDLSIPFDIFNVYEQRYVERLTYARELLKQGFDFSQKEEYTLIRERAPWPKTVAESQDLWRKRVKNDWLLLKLAGTPEATIRETLGKRYGNSLARAYKYKSDDVFQTFMTAYTNSIEPHTDYLGVAAASDFDISMKLSLVGIGAVLQERDEYTTIRELVPGGPAQLSGQLTVGDRIVGVAQGKDGTLVDVVGTRVNEVVKLIRGEKDTVVRLDILPSDAGPDGKHRLVTLVRDNISLDKQAAKKSVQIVKDGDISRKIGVISLPTFYEDFDARRRGDKDYRSASRDVAKLLAELEKENVDGVVIDLRNNGGGSLPQAIELTGFFVGKGPVLQQRNGDGEISVNGNKRATALWTGPLAVLINRGSASASEIFAAAIQDYGRGVIIGEPSFGKGTVQTVVDLDEEARNAKPEFGELKMTVAQFFRINGGTTQLRGVTPDIVLPGFSDEEKLGESSYDNALPWLQIKPAKFKALGDIKAVLPELQRRHDARATADKDFKDLVEDVSELDNLRKKQVISLNESQRRAERERQINRLKAREAADGKGSVSQADLVFQEDGLQANERSLSADIASEKALKDAKDVLLDETVHILSDASDLVKVKSAKNN
ncbi:MAG: carboxy terminal-processing peptidase [Phyllobacterium sp.]|uniref:carboxy terminal-processing peptidase n=1 Tax=Phyllobacterium sp. TaxID=1871046 RepID=UPI0030F25D84